MLGLLFASKEVNVINLSDSKIVEIKHNYVTCSKITLKTGSTIQYEILKTATHPSIIPILKLTTHSIYTNKITPLALCMEQDKKLYYKCIILKIKDALSFVHETVNREHSAVSIESIFISATGSPLLGNFGKSKAFLSSDEDFEQLDAFSVELTGLKSNEIEEDKDLFDFVFDITVPYVSSLKVESKIILLKRVVELKEEIPLISVKNLFTVFLKDIQKEQNKEYKLLILETLLVLNKEYFFDSKKMLFSIVDTTVRMFLLRTFQKENTIQMPLDDIVSDLSLGLKVKEKSIKKETVDFIFENSFSIESMSYLIEHMTYCNDTDTIALICSYLINLEQSGLEHPIYKVLYTFLLLGKSASSVYSCIDKYCYSFDKVKVSTELLPFLCSKLIEKENQEQCFLLVEKIIKFIKENKEEIQRKEWSLKNLSSIFNKKEDQKEKFDKRVSKFSKEEPSEWDGSEIL